MPKSTLLRVTLDRTAKLRAGTPLTGHLLDPVYLFDREVIPAGALLGGHVAGSEKIAAKDRIWQLLDGDVTPTRRPRVIFDTIAIPGHPVLAMTAPATERAATLIHMQNQGGHGRLAIFSMVKQQVHERLQQARATYVAPGKRDRLEQFFFNQLPYHPQRIWRSTQFDAELDQPLDLSALNLGDEAAESRCASIPQDQLPPGTLHARLLTGISSKDATPGEPIDAVLAAPVYAMADPASAGKLLLPQGARMQGVVMRARPARTFGRTGVLRFTLKQVSVSPEETCTGQQRSRDLALHGQVTGVEGEPGANVTLNSEGEARAGPSPNRLLAPLVLTVLLGRTRGDDGSNAGTGAVSGGGFGLVGRVTSLATRDANVTAGFAYYALAKSVVRRFILRGHEVEFPRNTRFDIEVTPRQGIDTPMR